MTPNSSPGEISSSRIRCSGQSIVFKIYWRIISYPGKIRYTSQPGDTIAIQKEQRISSMPTMPSETGEKLPNNFLFDRYLIKWLFSKLLSLFNHKTLSFLFYEKYFTITSNKISIYLLSDNHPNWIFYNRIFPSIWFFFLVFMCLICFLFSLYCDTYN